MAHASSALLASYSQRIADLHAQSVAADQAVRDALAFKIELTRQTGETIAAAKADLQSQEFRAAVDGIMSNSAVQAYLKLARTHPEPVTDLATSLRTVRQTLMASGALEFPLRGHQQIHAPSYFSEAMN